MDKRAGVPFIPHVKKLKSAGKGFCSRNILFFPSFSNMEWKEFFDVICFAHADHKKGTPWQMDVTIFVGSNPTGSILYLVKESVIRHFLCMILSILYG